MAAGDQEIEIRVGEYAHVMPDMSDEEYSALKRSIERDGLRHPIEVTEGGVIVDGHHRFKACEELGIEQETVVVEDATPESAFRSNAARRNLNAGELRDAVADYLEEHYDGDRSQRELADDLAVSQSTVRRALEQSTPTQSAESADSLSTQEAKQQVADYLEATPDASNREVARNVEADVSHPTVGEWRAEWEQPPDDDGGDPPTGGGSESADEPAEGEAAEPEPSTDDEPEPRESQGSDPGVQETEVSDPVESDTQPQPEQLDPHPMDDAGEGPGQSASERQLRRQLHRKNSRIDELETLIRHFIRAKENQDPVGLDDAVEEAKELVDDAGR